MLIRYTSSPVGPYDELLYVPGRYLYRDGNGTLKKAWRVTKIYVSTEESVVNGRINWGIPKNVANFDWTEDGGRSDVSIALPDGSFIAELKIQQYGFAFPLDSTILGYNLANMLPLVHPTLNADGSLSESSNLLRTTLKLAGRTRISRLVSVRTNPDLFPPLETLSISRMGVSVNNGVMAFQEPDEVHPAGKEASQRKMGWISSKLLSCIYLIIFSRPTRSLLKHE